MEYKPYKKRAQTQAQGDLIVTVALPTATEAAGIYGADLAGSRSSRSGSRSGTMRLCPTGS